MYIDASESLNLILSFYHRKQSIRFDYWDSFMLESMNYDSAKEDIINDIIYI